MPYVTPDEYLARERAADVKSEYFHGQIYAMAGGSAENSAIAANFVITVGAQLLDRPCQVYTNDMKVRAQPDGLFSYPDVSIVCGEPQFHDDRRDVLINPIVLVEVLSESTEAYDWGRKFIQYRQLPSLREYLLVAQDAPRIEHYARQPEEQWLLTTIQGLDATIALASIGCTLPLARIYRNVEFDSTAS